MANSDLKTSLLIALQTTGEERVAKLRTALVDLGISADKAEEMAAGLDSELGDIAKSSDKAQGGLIDMESALKGLLAGATVGQLAAMADQWSGINSRLKLATESQEAFTQAQADAFDISQRTGTALETTADLYSTINRTLKDLGGTQEQTADLTELINQSFRITGGGAAAMDGAIRQLNQALASGTLRGDEFNSVMEQAPRLQQALADALGVSKGELRAMAGEGKLASETVINALLTQKDAIANEYAQIAPTIGSALQQVENSWLKFLGELDKAQGASAGVASALSGLASNFSEVAEIALIAGESIVAAYAVNGVKAVYAYGDALAKNVAETYAKVQADREAARTAIISQQAEEAAAVATLRHAQAKTAATAAAVAEAEAHLADARLVGLYGEARAAAERRVTAAKTANTAATVELTMAERALATASAASASAQSLSAKSAGMLSATLGLLGGSAGLIIGAATAIYLFAQHQDKAAASTEELNRRLEEQGRKFDELSAKQLRVYLDDLEKQAKAAEREHQVAKARLETMDKQIGGYGDLTEWNRKYNQLSAEEESTGKKLVEVNNEIAKTKTRLAEIAPKNNQLTVDGNKATKESVQLAEDRVKLVREENSLGERSLKFKLELAKGELEVAKNTGQRVAAIEAANTVQKLEIELSNRVAAGKVKEAETDVAAAQEKYRLALATKTGVEEAEKALNLSAETYRQTFEEAQALEELNKKRKEAIDTAKALASAAREIGDAMSRLPADLDGGIGGIGEVMARWRTDIDAIGAGMTWHVNTMRKEFAALGPAAEDAFNTMLKGSRDVFGPGGLLTVGPASPLARMREQMGGLETATQGWIDRLSSSEASLTDVERAMSFLKSSTIAGYTNMEALGQERLDPLLAALDQAKRRLADIRDQAADTLSSLRDELDELNANYDDIERRRAKQREDDIQAQLAAARRRRPPGDRQS
ncbi:MAG: tape measure protein [Hydrogenophilales bacterium]|nr:tape measure protein [Hydrogenophilales bacterium]